MEGQVQNNNNHIDNDCIMMEAQCELFFSDEQSSQEFIPSEVPKYTENKMQVKLEFEMIDQEQLHELVLAEDKNMQKNSAANKRKRVRKEVSIGYNAASCSKQCSGCGSCTATRHECQGSNFFKLTYKTEKTKAQYFCTKCGLTQLRKDRHIKCTEKKANSNLISTRNINYMMQVKSDYQKQISLDDMGAVKIFFERIKTYMNYLTHEDITHINSYFQRYETLPLKNNDVIYYVPNNIQNFFYLPANQYEVYSLMASVFNEVYDRKHVFLSELLTVTHTGFEDVLSGYDHNMLAEALGHVNRRIWTITKQRIKIINQYYRPPQVKESINILQQMLGDKLSIQWPQTFLLQQKVKLWYLETLFPTSSITVDVNQERLKNIYDSFQFNRWQKHLPKTRKRTQYGLVYQRTNIEGQIEIKAWRDIELRYMSLIWAWKKKITLLRAQFYSKRLTMGFYSECIPLSQIKDYCYNKKGIVSAQFVEFQTYHMSNYENQIRHFHDVKALIKLYNYQQYRFARCTLKYNPNNEKKIAKRHWCGINKAIQMYGVTIQSLSSRYPNIIQIISVRHQYVANDCDKILYPIQSYLTFLIRQRLAGQHNQKHIVKTPRNLATSICKVRFRLQKVFQQYKNKCDYIDIVPYSYMFTIKKQFCEKAIEDLFKTNIDSQQPLKFSLVKGLISTDENSLAYMMCREQKIHQITKSHKIENLRIIKWRSVNKSDIVEEPYALLNASVFHTLYNWVLTMTNKFPQFEFKRWMLHSLFNLYPSKSWKQISKEIQNIPQFNELTMDDVIQIWSKTPGTCIIQNMAETPVSNFGHLMGIQEKQEEEEKKPLIQKTLQIRQELLGGGLTIFNVNNWSNMQINSMMDDYTIGRKLKNREKTLEKLTYFNQRLQRKNYKLTIYNNNWQAALINKWIQEVGVYLCKFETQLIDRKSLGNNIRSNSFKRFTFVNKLIRKKWTQFVGIKDGKMFASKRHHFEYVHDMKFEVSEEEIVKQLTNFDFDGMAKKVFGSQNIQIPSSKNKTLLKNINFPGKIQQLRDREIMLATHKIQREKLLNYTFELILEKFPQFTYESMIKQRRFWKSYKLIGYQCFEKEQMIYDQTNQFVCPYTNRMFNPFIDKMLYENQFEQDLHLFVFQDEQKYRLTISNQLNEEIQQQYYEAPELTWKMTVNTCKCKQPLRNNICSAKTCQYAQLFKPSSQQMKRPQIKGNGNVAHLNMKNIPISKEKNNLREKINKMGVFSITNAWTFDVGKVIYEASEVSIENNKIINQFYRNFDFVAMKIQHISEQKGLGIIATEDMNKGVFVGAYSGTIMRTDAINNPDQEDSLVDYGFIENTSMTLIPKTFLSHGRFFNGITGNQKPNLKAQWIIYEIQGVKQFGLILLTSQMIGQGEELVWDYGSNYWKNK